MGRDRLLPQQFDKISKRFGTPYFSIVIACIVIVIFAGLFYNNIETIASIVNFGSLFTYLFVNLSVLKLRRSESQTQRFFKVPLYPVVPIIGAISCVSLMFFLNESAIFVSAIWAAIGLTVFFVLYRKPKTDLKNNS